MMIPCVSCQSMFRLDDIYVKAAGSRVRCSKCHEIFKIFPPHYNSQTRTKNSNSFSNVAVVIPKVKHSLLDDLFQGESKPIEKATSKRRREESDNPLSESIEEFEEVDEDERIEDAELPDLSEIEEIVDSILDERDHINNISSDIQAKYSLTQDLNFNRV